MWAPRYFSTNYWASRYWTPDGDAVTPPSGGGPSGMGGLRKRQARRAQPSPEPDPFDEDWIVSIL